jgi:hypothetical protein
MLIYGIEIKRGYGTALAIQNQKFPFWMKQLIY